MGKAKRSALEQERSKRSFGRLEYWNAAFESGEYVQPFDWLASWEDLKAELEAIIPGKTARILIPGCGNAPFQLDMYRAGYENLVCGDNSEVVIKKMEAATKDTHPGIHWDLVDASSMPYPDGSFDVVIDKSLMDALLCSDDASKVTRLYFDEVFRVLAPGGLLVLVSCHKERSVRANLRGRDCRITSVCELSLKHLDSDLDDDPDEAGGARPGSSSATESCKASEPKGSVVTLCACVKGRGDLAAGEQDLAAAAPSQRKKARDERRKAAKMQRRMVQAHMEDADLA